MKKKYIYLIVGFTLSVILLGLLFSRGSSEDNTPIDSVRVIKSGNELTVFSDGSVVYKTSEGIFNDYWSKDKTDAFFDHFDSNYIGESQTLYATQDQISISRGGATYVYTVSEEDDELIDAATEDSQTNDSSDNSNNDSSNNSNNNNNSDNNSSNSAPTPTPTPYSGGGGSDTCLYWKLSYCVIPVTATPVPTATGTPDPNANVIEATGCGDYVTGGGQEQTIISNTVCLPTPTP